MSGSDSLRVLWDRMDAQTARYSSDEVGTWPSGLKPLLCASGLIRPCENADVVVCDACHEGHAEEVFYIQNPPGSPLRAYICCLEQGRVRIPLERLRQWEVDFDGGVETLRYAGAWVMMPSVHSRELHGESPEDTLAKCQQLSLNGYRPFTTSTASFRGELIAATLWYRPSQTNSDAK